MNQNNTEIGAQTVEDISNSFSTKLIRESTTYLVSKETGSKVVTDGMNSPFYQAKIKMPKLNLNNMVSNDTRSIESRMKKIHSTSEKSNYASDSYRDKKTK